MLDLKEAEIIDLKEEIHNIHLEFSRITGDNRYSLIGVLLALQSFEEIVKCNYPNQQQLFERLEGFREILAADIRDSFK